jgi:hypothetical protein
MFVKIKQQGLLKENKKKIKLIFLAIIQFSLVF